MQAQNKPWKSFQDQLSLLKSRGMQVDNEPAALDYLERIGYYRLSGYWYSFRELELTQGADGKLQYRRKDEFLQGSHFEDAVKLYVFDKKLRLLAIDALERIELAVRVDIAHLLGERDIHAHENPALFHGNFSKQLISKGNDKGKTEYQLWLEKYKHVLFRARRESFVKHYMQKYERLPIWVAIETWDFGMMSKLYAGLKHGDQDYIASQYANVDGRTFAGWLRSLNFIRNVSAHHSRLWNINVLELSKPYAVDSLWAQLDHARPFFYFCIMQMLMKKICPNSTWGARFAQLIDEFPAPSNGAVKAKDFGLIEGWKEWSLWQT